MPNPLEIQLEPAEVLTLQEMLKAHPKPYMRERAAAILKVHGGLSGREVALHRLNQRHAPDTIYDWIHSYLREGIAGLQIKPGRGRKPAFFPSVPRCRECAGGVAARGAS